MEFFTISWKKVNFNKSTKILTISWENFQGIYRPDGKANLQIKSPDGSLIHQNVNFVKEVNIQGKISSYLYSLWKFKVLK